MKLVIVPLALSELNDAAAFYSARANVEIGRASSATPRLLGKSLVASFDA